MNRVGRAASWTSLTLLACLATAAELPAEKPPPPLPHLIGHRGLIAHAPENTRAAFAACIELHVGFELDIRRSKDWNLVCLHDDDVKRTTNGTGKVADLTLAELRKLDAGRSFHPAFTGEKVPTLEEVFLLLKGKRSMPVRVALDFKIDDSTVAADVVRLAKSHDMLDRVICIGLAIEGPAFRRKLREADARVPVAVLAPKAEDLAAALSDRDSDWVYVRFIPTVEEVGRIHQGGKRVFLVGPLVMGREPENWRRALEAGVDALLTDYPLECRQCWRYAHRP